MRAEVNLEVYNIILSFIWKNLSFYYYIGEYHQYDNMAYPYVQTESKIVKIVKFWNWNSSDKELIVPDHDSMQSHSLKIYLEQYANDLSTCKISNIATVTEEIMHIYQSLRDPYVIIKDPTPWRAKALHKVRPIHGCRQHFLLGGLDLGFECSLSTNFCSFVQLHSRANNFRQFKNIYNRPVSFKIELGNSLDS